ncbi:MAG TPA: zinc-binding alcohol dehydrogenase family protein [Acidimicrobiales bacterium]|nr:zinc-binding alcohol dehydrogenase family protein [Acidimicrobiales bacterium]
MRGPSTADGADGAHGDTVARVVRAARLVEHGRPLALERVRLGEPGADDLVVEMAFAGVNPVDRYGALGRVAPDAPVPRTLGVEGIGRADGQWVVMHGHGLGTTRDGLWADAAVVPRAACVAVPEGVEPSVAAALGVAGATAYRTVVDLAKVTPDDRVLVLGASGGVGGMIVSLVHAIGAQVWGQTGSGKKLRAIDESGADRSVVADAGTLAAAVAELRPTVAFDPLGDGFTGAAVEALEPFGRLVLFGASADPDGRLPLLALYRKHLTILGYGGLIEPAEVVRRSVQGALEAVRDGRMSVRIDSVLALEDVNDALRRIAERDVAGKLVLALGER